MERTPRGQEGREEEEETERGRERKREREREGERENEPLLFLGGQASVSGEQDKILACFLSYTTRLFAFIHHTAM